MLTEREKKLMLAASENMYWEIACRTDSERMPDINIKQVMDDWLSSDVAEGGHIVEMIIHSQAGK